MRVMVPSLHLNCKSVGALLEAFRVFVEHRGVGYASHAAARPPKSLFFSTNQAIEAAAAGRVWHVSVDTAVPTNPSFKVEEAPDRSEANLERCFEGASGTF